MLGMFSINLPIVTISNKDDQMRSPLLLSGPKIRKAYFEASNTKNLIHTPPSKSDFRGVIKVFF